MNTDKSQIYDLWVKTFSLRPVTSVRNREGEAVTTFEVDSFLYTFLRENWSLLGKHRKSLLASITLLLKQKSKVSNNCLA
jgi:hypothetical protein